MYNTTNLTNAGDIFEITKAVNELSGSLFATLILLVVFFTMFAIMRNDPDKKKVFLVGSFVTSFIAIGLYFLQLIQIQALILPIIFLLISVFVKAFSDE